MQSEGPQARSRPFKVVVAVMRKGLPELRDVVDSLKRIYTLDILLRHHITPKLRSGFELQKSLLQLLVGKPDRNQEVIPLYTFTLRVKRLSRASSVRQLTVRGFGGGLEFCFADPLSG